MAITKNYSGAVLLTAGGYAIQMSFIGKLAALVATVPFPVTGGLAIYLFGTIDRQGIALMQEKLVDLFESRNLAIGAIIMAIGIGGKLGFEGGFLHIPIFQSVFPNGLPAIATAAVLGIAGNLIFMVVKPPR